MLSIFSTNSKNLTTFTSSTLSSARNSLRSFLARMDIPLQVWHLVEVMQKDFNRHHMMQVTITENQFVTIGMISQITEKVGMD